MVVEVLGVVVVDVLDVVGRSTRSSRWTTTSPSTTTTRGRDVSVGDVPVVDEAVADVTDDTSVRGTSDAPTSSVGPLPEMLIPLTTPVTGAPDAVVPVIWRPRSDAASAELVWDAMLLICCTMANWAVSVRYSLGSLGSRGFWFWSSETSSCRKVFGSDRLDVPDESADAAAAAPGVMVVADEPRAAEVGSIMLMVAPSSKLHVDAGVRRRRGRDRRARRGRGGLRGRDRPGGGRG